MSVSTDAVKQANAALQADPKAAKTTKVFGQAVTNWIVAQHSTPAYSVSNLVASRTLDAKQTSLDRIAAFVGTLAKDVQTL